MKKVKEESIVFTLSTSDSVDLGLKLSGITNIVRRNIYKNLFARVLTEEE